VVGMIRWVLLTELFVLVGLAIWVAGTASPSWVRMLLVGIFSVSAVIITFHLIVILLARGKED
jgi:hypothetical protein